MASPQVSAAHRCNVVGGCRRRRTRTGVGPGGAAGTWAAAAAAAAHRGQAALNMWDGMPPSRQWQAL